MMSTEQRKIVTEVYNHFVESEYGRWDELDESMHLLEALDDDQLHREADVVYYQHKDKEVRCPQDHSKDKCFIPVLIEAVMAILDLYKDTGSLHEKNKYILQYYLAMYQAGMILAS